MPEACGLCASRDLYETVMRGQVLQHEHIDLQLGKRVEGIICDRDTGRLTGATIMFADSRSMRCEVLGSDDKIRTLI